MKAANFLTIMLLGSRCAHPGKESGNSEVIPSLPLFVNICGDVWATRNLDVATYRNGDTIPKVPDANEWVKLTTGAWCRYNNDSDTYHAYGRPYNWYAMNDPYGLAPEGWHVLIDAERDAMETCLGEDSAGYRMREAGTAHWPGPVTTIDNSCSFNGVPSGMRSSDGTFTQGGRSAVYWTSVEGSLSEAWCGRPIPYGSATRVSLL